MLQKVFHLHKHPTLHWKSQERYRIILPWTWGSSLSCALSAHCRVLTVPGLCPLAARRTPTLRQPQNSSANAQNAPLRTSALDTLKSPLGMKRAPWKAVQSGHMVFCFSCNCFCWLSFGMIVFAKDMRWRGPVKLLAGTSVGMLLLTTSYWALFPRTLGRNVSLVSILGEFCFPWHCPPNTVHHKLDLALLFVLDARTWLGHSVFCFWLGHRILQFAFCGQTSSLDPSYFPAVFFSPCLIFLTHLFKKSVWLYNFLV